MYVSTAGVLWRRPWVHDPKQVRVGAGSVGGDWRPTEGWDFCGRTNHPSCYVPTQPNVFQTGR